MTDEGLVFAFARSDKGAWRDVGWKDIEAWRPGRGLIWIHLDRLGAGARDYLKTKSGLDPVIAEALLAAETRPRAFRTEDCLFLVLRGVNMKPGAQPEDMVALRVWIEPNRIISCRHRKVMAIDDLREAAVEQAGWREPGDFLTNLASALIERMAPVLHDLDDECDALEDKLVTGQQTRVRARLADVRREAIGLRRHLAPQRDAMARLQAEELSWLAPDHRARLRETSDRVTRYVEELDAIRERAAVVQDEVATLMSEQMNKNMFLLTIVATVLLPLDVITGLLGIGVDGIPWRTNAPWGFAAVTGSCCSSS